MIAAKARYGLASAPGIRVSVRRPSPWPTIRKPHVRLSWPQARVVGAHEPAAKRLYEFTFGARKIASSFRLAICPASQRLNVGLSPANALRPPRQSEEWMWHELPIHVWSGLAM